MTNEDRQQIAAILRDALDHAVESIANDFSDLREELGKRFDRIDLRFDTVERHLDDLIPSWQKSNGGCNRGSSAPYTPGGRRLCQSVRD